MVEGGGGGPSGVRTTTLLTHLSMLGVPFDRPLLPVLGYKRTWHSFFFFFVFRHGYACLYRSAFIPGAREGHRTVLQRLRSYQRITAEKRLRICGTYPFLFNNHDLN